MFTNIPLLQPKRILSILLLPAERLLRGVADL